MGHQIELDKIILESNKWSLGKIILRFLELAFVGDYITSIIMAQGLIIRLFKVELCDS